MDVRTRVKAAIRRRRLQSIKRRRLDRWWFRRHPYAGRGLRFQSVLRAALLYMSLVMFVAGFTVSKGVRIGPSMKDETGSTTNRLLSLEERVGQIGGRFRAGRELLSPAGLFAAEMPFLAGLEARGGAARMALMPASGSPKETEGYRSKLLEEATERPRSPESPIIPPELPEVPRRPPGEGRPLPPEGGRLRLAPVRGWGSKPLIAIYHSHSSEAYRPTSGENYVWGKPDGVITVGRLLAQELRTTYNIPVIHSEAIHDYPVWREAYMNSLVTITRILKENPSIEMVIDLHRDSVPVSIPAGGTIEIGGRRATRVFIVVTNDRFGLPHPNWRENYAFARYLAAKAEEMYPGLVRGVDLRSDGRWNQHVHPRAVIVEIGSVSNTREEAIWAARLMADVIASALDDLRR